MNRFANAFPFRRRELDWQSARTGLVSRAPETRTTDPEPNHPSQDARSFGQKNPSGEREISDVRTPRTLRNETVHGCEMSINRRQLKSQVLSFFSLSLSLSLSLFFFLSPRGSSPNLELNYFDVLGDYRSRHSWKSCFTRGLHRKNKGGGERGGGQRERGRGEGGTKRADCAVGATRRL